MVERSRDREGPAQGAGAGQALPRSRAAVRARGLGLQAERALLRCAGEVRLRSWRGPFAAVLRRDPEERGPLQPAGEGTRAPPGAVPQEQGVPAPLLLRGLR